MAAAVADPVNVPTSAGGREPIDLASSVLNFQKIESPQVSLHACAQRYGSQAIRSLFEKLEERHATSAFEELNLSDNEIGDDGARYLAEGLSGNAMLKRLLMPRTRMGSEGFKALGPLLATAPSLEVAVLSGNLCDPEGVQGEFCKGLGKNTSLKSLVIAANRLGDDGVKALCEPLRTHPQLEHVCLTYNRLSPAVAPSICEVFAANRTLQYLDLCGNSLGPKGAETLVKGLKQNKGCLKKLGVSTNELRLQGCKAFVDHFMSASGASLEFLDLRHNNVTYPGIVQLRKDLGKPISDDPTDGPGWLLLFGERQLLLNAF
jgi:Ran GTPase-activating protein (RanGAP) involved in mRNA processing and transport